MYKKLLLTVLILDLVKAGSPRQRADHNRNLLVGQLSTPSSHETAPKRRVQGIIDCNPKEDCEDLDCDYISDDNNCCGDDVICDEAGVVRPNSGVLANCLRSAGIDFIVDGAYLNGTSEWTRKYGLDVWDKWFQSRPTLYTRPKSAGHVSSAVKCAVAHNYIVTPRSGAHGYFGYARGMDGALVVDLRYLNSIELVDAAEKKVWIGSGNRLGRVTYVLYKVHGLAIPVGSCPAVGFGGFIVGGGQGPFSRQHGYASDNVDTFEVVLANGTLANITRTNEPDLFRSLSGVGGGNIAIVTGALIRAHKAPEKVTTIVSKGPPKFSSKSICNLGTYVLNADWRTGAFMGYTREGTMGIITFAGSKEDFQADIDKYLMPLVSSPEEQSIMSPPIESDMLTQYLNLGRLLMPLKSAASLNFPPDFPLEPVTARIRTSFVDVDRPLVTEQCDMLARLMDVAPGNGKDTASLLNLELTGGQMDLSDGYSVVVGRSTRVLLEASILNRKGPLTLEQLEWLDTAGKIFANISGPHMYINLVDPTVAHPGRSYYGDHFDYLKRMAAKYDPMGRFRFPFSVADMNE